MSALRRIEPECDGWPPFTVIGKRGRVPTTIIRLDVTAVQRFSRSVRAFAKSVSGGDQGMRLAIDPLWGPSPRSLQESGRASRTRIANFEKALLNENKGHLHRELVTRWWNLHRDREVRPIDIVQLCVICEELGGLLGKADTPKAKEQKTQQ